MFLKRGHCPPPPLLLCNYLSQTSIISEHSDHFIVGPQIYVKGIKKAASSRCLLRHWGNRHCCLWFSHWVVSDFHNPKDCSPPGSSLHGISQPGIQEWVTIAYSRNYRDRKHQNQPELISPLSNSFKHVSSRELSLTPPLFLFHPQLSSQLHFPWCPPRLCDPGQPITVSLPTITP